MDLTKMCIVADNIMQYLTYEVFIVIVNDKAIIYLIDMKISTVQ